jgi:hypothetical protein
MLFRVFSLFAFAQITCNCVLGQDRPTFADSPAYKEAYELICDLPERIRKAERLLLANGTRTLRELSANELTLLCRAYNELAEHDKQLAAAQELWGRFPERPAATRWIVNSKLNLLETQNDCDRAIDFADSALKDGRGIRSNLLLLKAEALLRKSAVPDATKRVMVSDLLIEAYATYEEIPGGEEVGDLGNTDIIDLNPSFSLFFSFAERETLKLRMKNARKVKAKR